MEHRLKSTRTVVLVLCWVTLCAAASSSSRCKYKYHTQEVEQKDFNRKRCWGIVKVRSCGGYCLTYEIPHWQFPYKESHHPVCVHDERRHKSVKLRNCDPGVEPGTETYHYVEAASCKCQVCSSEDTSCEWLPPDIKLEGLITNEEFPEEME